MPAAEHPGLGLVNSGTWSAETRSRCKSAVRERSPPERHSRPLGFVNSSRGDLQGNRVAVRESVTSDRWPLSRWRRPLQPSPVVVSGGSRDPPNGRPSTRARSSRSLLSAALPGARREAQVHRFRISLEIRYDRVYEPYGVEILCRRRLVHDVHRDLGASLEQNRRALPNLTVFSGRQGTSGIEPGRRRSSRRRSSRLAPAACRRFQDRKRNA
jgi:hypothetical protein